MSKQPYLPYRNNQHGLPLPRAQFEIMYVGALRRAFLINNLFKRKQAHDLAMFLSWHHHMAMQFMTSLDGTYWWLRKDQIADTGFGRNKVYLLETQAADLGLLKWEGEQSKANHYWFDVLLFNKYVELGQDLRHPQKGTPRNREGLNGDALKSLKHPEIGMEASRNGDGGIPKSGGIIDKVIEGKIEPTKVGILGAQKSAGADFNVPPDSGAESDSMGNQHVPNEQDQAPNEDWKDPLDEFQDNQGAPALPNNDPSEDIEDNDGMVIRGHSNLGPPCSGRPASRTNLEPSGQADKIWGQTQPRQRRRIKQ